MMLNSWLSSQNTFYVACTFEHCCRKCKVSEQMYALMYADLLLQADLESIRSHLLQRHGAYVNLTADERLLQAAQPLVDDFLQAMPVQAAQDADWTSMLPRLNEAITVPTQVPGTRLTLFQCLTSMLACMHLSLSSCICIGQRLCGLSKKSPAPCLLPLVLSEAFNASTVPT